MLLLFDDEKNERNRIQKRPFRIIPCFSIVQRNIYMFHVQHHLCFNNFNIILDFVLILCQTIFLFILKIHIKC